VACLSLLVTVVTYNTYCSDTQL